LAFIGKTWQSYGRPGNQKESLSISRNAWQSKGRLNQKSTPNHAKGRHSNQKEDLNKKVRLIIQKEDMAIKNKARQSKEKYDDQKEAFEIKRKV